MIIKAKTISKQLISEKVRVRDVAGEEVTEEKEEEK
jgi:hypothetical protein